jgi:Protein of unknown function (DUF2726)
MDSNFLLAAIVAIGLYILAAKLFGGKGRPPGYTKSVALLSKAERSFYGVLMKAVDNQYLVFCKVRVADVVTPRKGLSRKRWWGAFNRISAKHFDFVLCDPNDLSVKLVVELNDRSHQRSRRQKRDEFLRHVCESAGLRLVEVDAKAGYAIEKLRQLIITSDDPMYV